MPLGVGLSDVWLDERPLTTWRVLRSGPAAADGKSHGWGWGWEAWGEVKELGRGRFPTCRSHREVPRERQRLCRGPLAHLFPGTAQRERAGVSWGHLLPLVASLEGP